MKIGILTYFGSLNCGVNMQAYAVKKIISRSFPDAEIEFVNLTDRNRFFRPYLRETNLIAFINDFKRIKKFKKFINTNFKFSSQKLVTKNRSEAIEFIIAQNYDYLFVGSDTILEFHEYNLEENIPFYWLSPEIKAKKYLIAASSRNLSLNHLSQKQIKLLHKTINDFTYLAVRDEATYHLICQISSKVKKKLCIIPDPTFDLEIDYTFAKKYIENKKIPVKKKIAALHLTSKDHWASALAKKLKKHGFITVSFKPATYVDIQLNDLGPLEYIGIMKYFDIVITHRFHDSVFCFKNNTPVITYTPGKQYLNTDGESKYTNLFRLFKMEEFLFNDMSILNADIIFDRSMILLEKHKSHDINEVLINLKQELDNFIKNIP